MKSLIKKPQQAPGCCAPITAKDVPTAKKVAQCCAKVSKNVAGCHD